MPKEQFIDNIRKKIGNNQALGWQIMQDVGMLFEDLCIPGGEYNAR